MRQTLIPTYNLKDKTNKIVPWDTSQVQKYTQKDISKTSLRAAERLIEKSEIIPEPIRYQDVLDEKNCSLKSKVLNEQLLIAKKKRNLIYTMQLSKVDKKLYVLLANDGRSGRKWFWLKEEDLTSSFIESCLVALLRNTGKNIWL